MLKKLYGCDPVPPDLTASHLCQDGPLLAKAVGLIAKKTCRACAVPCRYFVHCHELLPKFLSQIDISSDVLKESDLLPEAASEVSKCMFHEATIPIDSGYHSPHPTVRAHLDASRGTMVPCSTHKVPHLSPKAGTLMDPPGNEDEILSPVLCKDTGCPDIKFPGQVLPIASTPRVSRENLTNAGSICAPLEKSQTFGKPSYPISCNCIMGPIEEKVLSSIELSVQNMTASYPLGVDEYSKDCICLAPTHVQPKSTHGHANTSTHEPLNCPRLVLMAKGQLQ